MKNYITLFSVLISIQIMSQNPIQYPNTTKINYTDTYFNTIVEDPYRWLEDDRSPETEAWVKAQNQVTFGYLEQIPYREKIKTRIEKLWNYEKVSAPFKEGKYMYFYKNNGLQNQSVLYRKLENSTEEIFLDPNTFSKDGTTSLASVNFTNDGNLVAYSISEAGSDWRKVIVLNAITKEKIGETLIDVKFSGISWYKNEGFYYSSYDKPNGSELSAKTDQHKLYYHKLNSLQKEDKLIFGETIKRRYVGGYVTDKNDYLIISGANTTSGGEVYYLDLNDKNAVVQNLISTENLDFNFVDNNKNIFYFETNKDAPNRKFISIDIKNPLEKNWKTIIKETENVLNIETAGKYIFASYMKDAISKVYQFDFTGKQIREIILPGIGTATGFSAKKEDTILYFSFTNYTTPNSIFSLNLENGKYELYKKPNVDFESDKYESKQIFYNSKDGTKIPMIITHKKGLQLNGKNPTILYGYGGFNISLTPTFSVPNAVWLEKGGIYAVANLRGGGEYGKKWHVAGTQLKKQNVFDDFIAAAEYLIAKKYTSTDYLAISGRSNGGLLVGAVMTQRPDLMKVALPGVGVLDMLRYHTFTAGAGWSYDYGTAEQSKEMFEYLKNYSPVHNVKNGTKYPATLVITSDHDDRVVPAHSFKFAANLQEKQAGNYPVLVRIDVNAGHGQGRSLKSTISEYTDLMVFTLFNMGIKL